MHNSLWPNTDFYDVLEAILRTSFKHIQYLNVELVGPSLVTLRSRIGSLIGVD